MRLTLAILTIVMFFAPCGYGFAEENQSISLRIIPSGHLFSPLLAEPLSPIPTLKWLSTTGDETTLAKLGIGTVFGLLRLDTGISFQLNIEGGVFSRADMFDRVVLQTIDYRIGFPLDIARTSSIRGWALQIAPYHTSSHLIDDFLLKDVEFSDAPEPISYSRNIIRSLVAYRFSPDNRIYAGVSYSFDDVEFDHLINFQGGSEFFTPPLTFTGHEVRLFLAEDLQVEEETDWNPAINLQAGFAINGVGQENRFRFAIEYFAGNIPEGQFKKRKEQTIGISASFHQ